MRDQSHCCPPLRSSDGPADDVTRRLLMSIDAAPGACHESVPPTPFLNVRTRPLTASSVTATIVKAPAGTVPSPPASASLGPWPLHDSAWASDVPPQSGVETSPTSLAVPPRRHRPIWLGVPPIPGPPRPMMDPSPSYVA